MSKLHYNVGGESACGLKRPARSTNVREDVDCGNCRRTAAIRLEWQVHRLSDEELNDLAIKVVRGDTYIANSDEDLRFSFGHMFALMSPPPRQEWIEQIGAVYEDWAKAGPRSINGYPFFFSMKVLHKEDLERLHEKIEAKKEALQTA